MSTRTTTSPSQSFSSGRLADGLLNRGAVLETKRREAEIDIAGFREEKLHESLVRESENLRELVDDRYDPWGKPGNGAPMRKPDHKKQKFTEYGGFKNDVSFMGLFDNNVAGKPSNAASSVQSEQQVEEAQARINNFREELRMVRSMRAQQQPFQYYDPWGKGAGNPRRSQDGYVERFPAIKERGIVPLPQNKDANFLSDELQDRNAGVGLSLDSQYGGGGAPSKTRSGHIKTRFPTTMERDIYGNVSLKDDGASSSQTMYQVYEQPRTNTQEYFPFGKPGGGAPVKTDSGNIVQRRRGMDFNRELDTPADVHRRKQAADEYLVELQKGMTEQKGRREHSKYEKREPMGELAQVVRQGQVGYPRRDPTTGQLANQHRGTSDVTKQKMAGKLGQIEPRALQAGLLGNNAMPDKTPSKNYYDDLTRLAEERHRQRQHEKEADLRQENAHTENWTDMWGRPGGGAPKNTDTAYKKVNLDLALHGTNGSINPAKVMSKHVSSHENNFEVGEDRTQLIENQIQSGQLNIIAPWGTS